MLVGLMAYAQLNTQSEVENYLFGDRYWLKMGADGFRLDVCHYMNFRLVRRLVSRSSQIPMWEKSGTMAVWLAGDQFDAVMNYCLGSWHLLRHQRMSGNLIRLWRVCDWHIRIRQTGPCLTCLAVMIPNAF